MGGMGGGMGGGEDFRSMTGDDLQVNHTDIRT
jgi:hypothetical protein